MATSGEMIRVFADALGLTEAYVAARYRALRECGLVSKGGRGRFAPSMTALDGARLLIAVMGAQAIADTRAAVEIFGKAEGVTVEGENDPLTRAIDALPFEQTLALILEACVSYRLGEISPFDWVVRGVTITVSPTRLTATLSREGFHAEFLPAASKGFASEVRLSGDMTPSDRLWLRADRAGLQINVAVEAPELLELAPAIGPGDATYRPTH